MICALVHYLSGEIELIDSLRRKYDPQFDLIKPHITMIFPLPDTVGEQGLVAHVGSVLQHWRPFPIHLAGFERSADGYLFLLLQEGKTKVTRLHNELYTGMLAQHRRGDAPFVPHVTLGVFGGDAERYLQALEEARRLNLNYEGSLDRAHLVKVDDERTRIIWSKEFLLGADLC